jgi:Zn-finger nucleic acid-binding protein
MICPYCEVEITMSQVDAEDGYCPECGSAITPSTIFMDQEEIEDDELEELDDFGKNKKLDGLDDDF